MPVHNIPLAIIPIEEDGFHLMVEGYINDKKAMFLVDTGASRTVLDVNSIMDYIEKPVLEKNEQLSTGLGTNTMPSQVTTLNKLQFGDLIIQDYQAVIIDLKYVHQSYSMLELPLFQGVLGGDILKGYKAVINYKKKELKLYD